MTIKTARPLLLAALLGAALFPAACVDTGAEFREVTAERIARPAFMVERRLTVDNMEFQLWERMHERYAPVNIYIEGDGAPTYLNRDITQDATPNNPVGLHLASRDLAKNLVYISRPCAFKESPEPKACDPKYWSTRRFSPEVFTAYNKAIDEIKAQYDLNDVNLIGYDGGANIAAVLATMRKDVRSVRTVAGNLHPDMVYAQPPQKLDADNIRAIDVAPALAKIPQHHFIGAGDEIVPPAVYHSFRQSMGESACVHYSFVQDADHTRGWVEKWPDLLKSSLECEPEHIPVPLPPRPIDKDGPNK